MTEPIKFTNAKMIIAGKECDCQIGPIELTADNPVFPPENQPMMSFTLDFDVDQRPFFAAIDKMMTPEWVSKRGFAPARFISRVTNNHWVLFHKPRDGFHFLCGTRLKSLTADDIAALLLKFTPVTA